jgi:hypothetical protein
VLYGSRAALSIRSLGVQTLTTQILTATRRRQQMVNARRRDTLILRDQVMKQIVVSREFKVMLKPERFFGSRAKVLVQARRFWQSFRDATSHLTLHSRGNLGDPQEPTIVRFYDTTDHCLYSSDYILRERVGTDTAKGKVTLKFRHPDRYICADRDMTGHEENSETKFEEDIKLPFQTLYSFSTTQRIRSGNALNRLRDLFGLYPGLEKQLRRFEKGAKLQIVRDFVAEEIVITGAVFGIRRNPKAEAECALIVWYDKQDKKNRPVVVEFSFRYGNTRGEYERKSAQRAYDVFGALLKVLRKWLDAKGPTKTAFVYGYRDSLR